MCRKCSSDIQRWLYLTYALSASRGGVQPIDHDGRGSGAGEGQSIAQDEHVAQKDLCHGTGLSAGVGLEKINHLQAWQFTSTHELLVVCTPSFR